MPSFPDNCVSVNYWNRDFRIHKQESGLEGLAGFTARGSFRAMGVFVRGMMYVWVAVLGSRAGVRMPVLVNQIAIR